ncbi:hypothetical protein [Chloracidobacterium aggregatum]|uniref:hypothetical protein n=1 Tax=Chloracidobacterium aggregatum TaxID=2851959 RepID=UPI002016C1AD|nr:hypothetical protein [Chloracidobacterium aggregatum]
MKYYELEQFEDTLSRARYEDSSLFTPPAGADPCQYVFLRDPKMLDALEISPELDEVQLNLGKLYRNIDLPETLSNLTGKRVRRIQPGLQPSAILHPCNLRMVSSWIWSISIGDRSRD